MKNFCANHNIKHIFYQIDDHRGCGLVERLIQTIKIKITGYATGGKCFCNEVMLKHTSLRSGQNRKWLRFEAPFVRLPLTEFTIQKKKIITNSATLDKQHLEWSALTASQLKRRLDNSRDHKKIVQQRQLRRKVSPIFKQQTANQKERERQRVLKNFMEAKAACNEMQDATKCSWTIMRSLVS